MTDTTDQLQQLIPQHAHPDGLPGRLAALLAQGWTSEQLQQRLAHASWAGRGPGWTVMLLRGLAADGPHLADQARQRTQRSQETAPRRWVQTTDHGTYATGVGRRVLAHPFAGSDLYCDTCQLPAANSIHG